MTQIVQVLPSGSRLDVPNNGPAPVQYLVTDDAGNPLPDAVVEFFISTWGGVVSRSITNGSGLTPIFSWNSDGQQALYGDVNFQVWAVAIGCSYGAWEAQGNACVTPQYPSATSDSLDVYIYQGAGPGPTCNEGEFRSAYECPDESQIFLEVCQGNQWVPSGQECGVVPSPPINPDLPLIIVGAILFFGLMGAVALRLGKKTK